MGDYDYGGRGPGPRWARNRGPDPEGAGGNFAPDPSGPPPREPPPRRLPRWAPGAQAQGGGRGAPAGGGAGGGAGGMGSLRPGGGPSYPRFGDSHGPSDGEGRWGRKSSASPGGGAGYQEAPQRGYNGGGAGRGYGRGGFHSRGAAAGPRVEAQGVVRMTRQNWGFIHRAPDGEKHFFHVKEVLAEADGAPFRPLGPQEVLRDRVPAGTEVAFKHLENDEGERGPDGKVKRTAFEVVLLAPGTIEPDDTFAAEERQGTVVKPLSGAMQCLEEGYGGLIEVAGGDGEAEERLVLPFSGLDLEDKAQEPMRGDKVAFTEATSKSSGKARAARVKIVDDVDESALETGFIAFLKERYGFIRCADRDGTLFFHFGSLPGQYKARPPAPGTEVSFVVSEDEMSSGKQIATRIKILPKGSVTTQKSLGKFKGTVTVAPQGPRTMEVDDGVIEYTDPEAGATGTARFGKYSIDNPRLVFGAGDTVEFEAVRHKAKNQVFAKDIAVLEKAARSEGPPPPRADEVKELGVIGALKNNFGFVKCVDRPVDIFFHFSSLTDLAVEDLRLGMDVEFVVSQTRDGRLMAQKMARAARGAAVFETYSEEVYEGKVVVKMFYKGQYSSGPNGNRPGLIEATIDGQKASLPYGINDLDDNRLKPNVDELVTFRIATDVKREKASAAAGKPGLGRRAVKVALKPRQGRVVATKNGYGFIEFQLTALDLALRDGIKRLGVADLVGKVEDKPLPEADESLATLVKEAVAGEGSAPGAEGDGAAPPAVEPVRAAVKTKLSLPACLTSYQRRVVHEACSHNGYTSVSVDGGGRHLRIGPAESYSEAHLGEKELESEPATAFTQIGGEHPEYMTESDLALLLLEHLKLDITPFLKGRGAHQFKDVKGNKLRVFYHQSEVHEGVQLGPGDEVEFVLVHNPKVNDLNARRVRCTLKAAPCPEPAERPESMKFTGRKEGVTGTTVMRMTKQPDGTRGFQEPAKRQRTLVLPVTVVKTPPPEPEPVAEEASPLPPPGIRHPPRSESLEELAEAAP